MKHLGSTFIAVWVLGLAPQLVWSQTADAAPAQGGVQLGRLLRESNAELPVYACDLRNKFNQCRQYAVAPGNAEFRVQELTDACASLEGVLMKSACPKEDAIAYCKEVKFRRDVAYDATYYQGMASIWTLEKVKEVCRNLPGYFAAAEQ